MRESPADSHFCSVTYLLTLISYGCRVPGNPRGARLSASERKLVAEVMRNLSSAQGWRLLAVRAHAGGVFAVVHSTTPPGRMIVDFKTHTSRHLNEGTTRRRRWEPGGSAVRLVSEAAVRDAIQFVSRRPLTGG